LGKRGEGVFSVYFRLEGERKKTLKRERGDRMCGGKGKYQGNVEKGRGGSNNREIPRRGVIRS